MHPADLPVFLLRRPRQDFLMGLFTAQLFWGGMAFAQRSTASFGLYAETRLSVTPSSVLVYSPEPGAPPVILVGSAQSPVVLKFRMSSEGRIIPAGRIPTPMPVCQLASADITNDRRSDIVALSADGLRIMILDDDDQGGEPVVLRLSQRSERLTFGDVNGDGRLEVLVHGRTMPGVATFSASGSKAMRRGPLLFPELSVSDMAAMDLNDDGIVDVALCHWLSNRLVVRFGIGGGAFSDQNVLDLPAEPDRLNLTRIARTNTIQMLVTLPEARGVAHLVGFPTGELAVREVIPLPYHPTGVRFARINDDLLPDLVCATEGGFAVSPGAVASSFARITKFGAGADAISWTAEDVHGDGVVDLVFVEPPNRLAVLSNARTTPEEETPRSYATGAAPVGLLLRDLDGDGLVDIATANRGSGSLSIFYNRGDGDFDGQQGIDVGRSPEHLFPADPSSGPGPLLLISHPSENQLSVVTLYAGARQPSTVAVPTGAHPEVVHAERSAASGRMRILIRYADPDAARAPIALIERSGGNQFIERSYRWPPQTSIAAMAFGWLSGNAQGDLIMAVRERRAQSTSIAVTPPVEGFDYRRFVKLIAIPDSVGVPEILLSGPVNSDASADLVIVTGEPSRAVGVAQGTRDHRLTPPAHWIRNVHPLDRHSILLIDADGDGPQDLVYLDGTDRSVKVLYGRGDGRFSNPVTALGTAGVSAFGVGPLFVGGGNALVVTDRESHTFTIYRGVFRR